MPREKSKSVGPNPTRRPAHAARSRLSGRPARAHRDARMMDVPHALPAAAIPAHTAERAFSEDPGAAPKTRAASSQNPPTRRYRGKPGGCATPLEATAARPSSDVPSRASVPGQGVTTWLKEVPLKKYGSMEKLASQRWKPGAPGVP